MVKSFSSIAIIPARGGSKRISRKNIKLINGKPAIAYSIEIANRANLFDEIFVSTEDHEIAEVAENLGANVTFRRESHLAGDMVSTIDVIATFIQNLPRNLISEETTATCVYPVVPLLNPARLQEAQDILEINNSGYVFPVLPLISSPTRSFKLSQDMFIENVDLENQLERTQDLTQYYYDAGQFYSARATTWLSRIPIFTPKSVGLKMKKWEVVDVDTAEDWLLMEQLLRSNHLRGSL